MEKNSNPAALTPQGVDQEAFDRVWRRVMPDQAQSPIAIGRAEVDEIAPAETAPQDQCEAAPVPAETPVQPAASPTPPPPSRSKAEEEPPFCLGQPVPGGGTDARLSHGPGQRRGLHCPRPWSAGAEAAPGH